MVSTQPFNSFWSQNSKNIKRHLFQVLIINSRSQNKYVSIQHFIVEVCILVKAKSFLYQLYNQKIYMCITCINFILILFVLCGLKSLEIQSLYMFFIFSRFYIGRTEKMLFNSLLYCTNRNNIADDVTCKIKKNICWHAYCCFFFFNII